MIVVVGVPGWRRAFETDGEAGPAGRAAHIALAAAAAGARVELVGRTGDDPEGDALLIALTRANVGHAAMLRDPARATPIEEVPGEEELSPVDHDPNAIGVAGTPGPALEPEDVELGLRYVAGFDVLVASDEVPARVLPVCVEAAQYGGARLVIALGPSAPEPDDLPPDATVLVAPDVAGDAFARLVGTYAAALDRGEAPEAAFEAATSGGWERPAS